ncbi:ewing's tumor-associated antigen 1 [Sander vitreus]
MNRGRGNINPPCGLMVTFPPQQQQQQQQQAAPSKPNRLRRSFKRTQQTQTAAELDSPKSQESDFKTPTRIQRPRAVGGFSAESPHNDSDFQQDIIWDATSPSPNRLGKRGKKPPVAVVNISEIVKRIAPKHGRPTVAEPTLQQWIGDSATIPCTPDVQVPRPKKKSPRPNGVDDLLKLAKQFDFNMFHQDEDAAEQLHQQSLELLSEDILDFESDFSPSPPGNRPPATKATTDAQPHADQHMEDDLDFLFDAPTQHVSGNLSQMASTAPPASGKPSASSLPPPSGVPTTHAHARKGAPAHDEFEDDWANDDFLNDSLVLEMTQNPQSFVAPKHCSTQKTPSSVAKVVQSAVPQVVQSAVPQVVQSAVPRVFQSRVTNNTYQRESPVPQVVQSAVPQVVQSAPSKVEKDNVRQRTTFKLESNPSFSVGRIPTDAWATSKVGSSLKKSENGARLTLAPFPQRTSVPRNNTAAPSNPTAANASRSFPTSPAVVSSRGVPDEDLSAFFSSEPAWDDPADDDLLCEMCDDLENQIQSAESVPARRALPAHQREALQPSNRMLPPANQQAFPPKKQTLTPTTRLPAAPGRAAAAGPSLAAVSYVTATDSFRCTQAKNTSSSTNVSACVQGGGPGPSAPPCNARKDQFTFKKPSNAVATTTSKVVGKCSAAEIELKKQQAMERRRQRLLAAGNLRAPT